MLKAQLLRETAVETAGELLEVPLGIISSRALMKVKEGSETMHLLPKSDKLKAKI